MKTQIKSLPGLHCDGGIDCIERDVGLCQIGMMAILEGIDFAKRRLMIEMLVYVPVVFALMAGKFIPKAQSIVIKPEAQCKMPFFSARLPEFYGKLTVVIAHLSLFAPRHFPVFIGFALLTAFNHKAGRKRRPVAKKKTEPGGLNNGVSVKAHEVRSAGTVLQKKIKAQLLSGRLHSNHISVPIFIPACCCQQEQEGESN